MSGMDFKTVVDVISSILSSEDSSFNYPIMLRGRHGIGKSELVYQIASNLSMPVVERRASQMQDGDLVGMPDAEARVTESGNKVATFNSFDWLVECCEHPRVLFFDEVDRGFQSVRQGIMELTDSRKLFGKVLHPKTIIFSAVNGGVHAANYQVGELDQAELDRWTVYDVEPTVDDWLTWAKDNVSKLMWDFINHNRDHLEHTGEFEPSKVYPSRRSITRLDRVLRRAGMYEGSPDEVKSRIPQMTNVAIGFVGLGTASAFGEFVAKYEFQLTPEDIIVKGRWKETLGWGINQHLAMSRKIGNSNILDNKLNSDELYNLANYFVSLPSEVVAQFWVHLSGGEDDEEQNPNLESFCSTVCHNGLKTIQYYGMVLHGLEQEALSKPTWKEGSNAIQS